MLSDRMTHSPQAWQGGETFVSVEYIREGLKMCFVGCLCACQLAEFIVEIIHGGHYSILGFLVGNGF